MAGQAERSGADRAESSARRSASPGRSPAGRRTARVPVLVDALAQVRELEWLEPLAPDFRPREIETRAAYRRLIGNGLAGPEAAGVIGFVVGLAQPESPWSLPQINELLFLRDLYLSTPWGETERRTAQG